MSYRYRRLDANGDYSFGRGNGDFLSGTEATAQAIKTRLLLLLKEWWEDEAQGLPLFQSILGAVGSQENLQAVNLLIRERILGTPEVKEISDYEGVLENRKYSFSCSVTTTLGDLIALEEVVF